MREIECKGCGYRMGEDEFKRLLKVCPKCDYHHIMGAFERLGMLADENSFVEYDSDLYSVNSLNFPNYDEKLAQDREKTGLKSEMLTGECTIGGYRTVIAIGDSRFRMGSMGSVVGEKITRCMERAIDRGLPVVIVSAFGGGARMQEGTIALMQMAKTSATCAKLSKAGLLYISVITHPTMGGTAASFASLGHIIMAEPGAMIGFAGPRSRASIREELPPNFQRSEFLLEHGMLDLIVQRAQMKATLAELLRFFWER
jgi:acetyl-CoA carboxylase carboxyl transferase subunit beta